MNKRRLEEIIKEELLWEAQWGNFTGGADPLDTPMRDSGPVPEDQLKKLWDMFIDMGKTPEEILAMPEFKEAGIEDPAQLGDDEEIMAETSPTFGLRTGDMVRHKDEPERGVGKVVAKSNKRDRYILVLWADRTQQRHDPSALIKEK